MGAAATGFPLTPSTYVAGTVTISAGQANAPQQLLALVQAQLDANAIGVSYEVTLQTDGSGILYVGRQNLVGPLSTANYGYQLPSGGTSRTYRSGSPGSHSSIGDLQVLMSTAGTFHIEIAGG